MIGQILIIIWLAFLSFCVLKNRQDILKVDSDGADALKNVRESIDLICEKIWPNYKRPEYKEK